MPRSLSVLALCLLSALAATASSNPHERELLASVQCHILADATRFVSGEARIAYKCIPQRDDGTLMPLQFEVAEALVQGKEAEILNGRAYALYTNAYLQERDGLPDELVTSADSQLIFQDDPLDRRRLGVKKTGESSVFVARVIANDAAPSFSKGEISNSVFGDGDPTVRNLVNVFRDCSMEALTMVPAEGPGVSGGVGDVRIDRNIGNSLDGLLNVVSTKLEEQYDTSDFDHHLFVIPEGTGGWSAGAFIGGYQSYFNDHQIMYVSSVVHEIGHNIGMGHASVTGATGQFKDYEDQSGFMGYSYNVEFFPRMCFNGQKNFEFGWYQERSATLNLVSNGPFVGRLNAFVDYRSTSPGDYVLISYANNHIQFNSKKGINSQTIEAINKVTITGGSGAEVSYRMAELSMSNPTYTMDGTQGRAVIELCDYNAASDSYRISVYLRDSQTSACDDASGGSTTYNSNCTPDTGECVEPGECCSGKCSMRDSPNPFRGVCMQSSSSSVIGIEDRGRGSGGRGGGGGAGGGGGSRGGNLRG